MRRYFFVLALAGCADAGPDYPVATHPNPNGTTEPTGGNVARMGRVCMVGDAWALSSCDATGAGNLSVSVGGRVVATTSDDGSFEVPAGVDGDTMTIAGSGVVPTTATFPGTGSALVPILDDELFQQMLDQNAIVPAPGTGAILGTVTRADGSIGNGVSVATDPVSAVGPFYDGTESGVWSADATGARGIVFVPSSTAGSTSLTFTDLASGATTTVDRASVSSGGVTMVSAELP